MLFFRKVKIRMNTFIALLKQNIFGFFHALRWNHDIQITHVARAEITISLQSHNRTFDRQDTNVVFLKPFHDTHQFGGFCEDSLRISVGTIFQAGEREFRDAVSFKPVQILVHRRRHPVAVHQSDKDIPIDRPPIQFADLPPFFLACRGPKTGEDQSKFQRDAGEVQVMVVFQLNTSIWISIGKSTIYIA